MSESKKIVNENVPMHDGLTPSDIEKLKRKHKTDKVSLITATTEEGDEVCFWFKKIDMPTLSLVYKYMESDPLKAVVIIFRNTLIKGEDKYADDPSVMLGISGELMSGIGKATATLKKF